MKRRDALSLFFELTNNDKDSLAYLNLFRQASESFALIYIENNAIMEIGENFLFNLKVLEKLKLFPVVLLDESSLDYINLFYKNLINYEKNFKANSVSANIISMDSDLFMNVSKSTKSNRIPFIISKKESSLESEKQKIIKSIKSGKFIYLTGDTYFQRLDSIKPISIINLQKDKKALLSRDDISAEEKDLLEKFNVLLNEQNTSLKSISITSPMSLFKELFTIKGSGTLIKKGSSILKVKEKSELDINRLKILLEQSFRKKIKEQFMKSEFHSILFEENYRGGAIFKNSPYGVILSKFAVDEIARGEGIGRDIWEEMLVNYKSIIWRSKKENPINKWYMKECQGMFKNKNWIVYWIGLDSQKISSSIEYMNNLEEDFD